MGKILSEIDERLREWITVQRMFFTATAPSGDGHINCSPKGCETFRIFDAKTVAYVDLTGSGIETIAHLKENGRITVMFCAFEGAPRILRLYGEGIVVESGTNEFKELIDKFAPLSNEQMVSARAIIKVSVSRITDSCGYGVPLMKYEGERTQLSAWVQRKGSNGIAEYRQQKNLQSIDGLPGLDQR
jgi:hypothetical protein